MNDIYIELKDIAEKNNISVKLDSDEENNINKRRKSSIYEMMPDFKNQVIIVQTHLRQIKLNVGEIENLKQKSNNTVTPNKEREISKNLNKILRDNEKLVEAIKTIVNKLATDVELSKKNEPDEPETQAKINNLRSIQKELLEIMKDTQTAQTDYKANIKEKIGRQIDILDDQINKEEKNKLMNDPEGFQKLIAKKTLGNVPLQLKYAVDDILDKYDDIKKLENSVNYVYQMFSDIALLVHNQSEELDSIEMNVNNAKNYIEKAEKVLVEAKKEHQKSRKKMCCVLIVGLVLLVVVVTPVTLKTLNQI